MTKYSKKSPKYILMNDVALNIYIIHMSSLVLMILICEVQNVFIEFKDINISLVFSLSLNNILSLNCCIFDHQDFDIIWPIINLATSWATSAKYKLRTKIVFAKIRLFSLRKPAKRRKCLYSIIAKTSDG